MAVERLTSLSAGVLADRADRELAEIVEAAFRMEVRRYNPREDVAALQEDGHA